MVIGLYCVVPANRSTWGMQMIEEMMDQGARILNAMMLSSLPVLVSRVTHDSIPVWRYTTLQWDARVLFVCAKSLFGGDG